MIMVAAVSGLAALSQRPVKEVKSVKHEAPKRIKRVQPFYTKGIYLSSWTAGDNSRMNQIIDFLGRTELNTLVIDIKDSTGHVAYDSQVAQVKQWDSKEVKINNLNRLLDNLYQKGIYTIARLPVFEDTELAVKNPNLALKNKSTGKIWRDHKGLAWVDPASEEVWAYNIALAREAFELGFDEVNFDYVRFPSDGDISQITYPFWDGKTAKAEVMRKFFEYQKINLEKYGPRSVDLFGLNLWHVDDGSDMNIGQRLVHAMPYFDYICPMVYPSHYPPNFDGFANPAAYPYEIIYRNLNKVKPVFERWSQTPNVSKVYLRPWLQAFNLGANYTPEMVLAEKKAVEDGGGYGWLLWNAKNNYLSIESVVKINNLK